MKYCGLLKRFDEISGDCIKNQQGLISLPFDLD